MPDNRMAATIGVSVHTTHNRGPSGDALYGERPSSLPAGWNAWLKPAAVPGLFRLPPMRPVPHVRHPEIVIMRCLLVDDNTAVLEIARGRLARDGVTVPGTASCSAEAVRQAAALRPDVAVVDIGLGAENGFDLARDLATQGITVIMTSTGAEDDYADLVAVSPVAGFLAKAELSAAGILRILGSSFA
jgi:two-component system, NarL family, nitrate/nitrite response regulator NarL